MLYAASIKFEAKVSSLIFIFNGESIVLDEIIRIYKECEGWIENLSRESLFDIKIDESHETCRMITNGDSEGRILYPNLKQIIVQHILFLL